MINCLHICNDFLGSGIYTNLYGSLDKLGICQQVYHPYRNKDKTNAHEKTKHLKKFHITYSKSLKLKHRIFFRIKTNYLYKDLLGKVNSINDINIVHATTLFSDGAIALKLYEDFGIPYVINVRATDISIFLKYRKDLYPICRKILENSESIIFVSDSLKKKFFKHPFIKQKQDFYISKSEIIYNGVGKFWHEHSVKKKNKFDGKLLYVGTFINRKNALLVGNSILDLNRSGKNYTITFVGGGGAQEEKIKELASKNSQEVIYKEKIKEKEALKEVYRNHDILILPSLSETFGLVYIEALSQGIPVIFCKNEGIDGIFDERIGLDCDPNTNSLKTSILKISENYNFFDLKSFQIEQFDWNNIAEKYISIYQTTTKKHSNNKLN